MAHCGALCSVPSILEQYEHPKYLRLKIQLRQRSRFYQAVTFLDGRKVQTSLKTDALETAFKLVQAPSACVHR